MSFLSSKIQTAQGAKLASMAWCGLSQEADRAQGFASIRLTTPFYPTSKHVNPEVGVKGG